jgi:hypothetical protein
MLSMTAGEVSTLSPVVYVHAVWFVLGAADVE